MLADPSAPDDLRRPDVALDEDARWQRPLAIAFFVLAAVGAALWLGRWTGEQPLVIPTAVPDEERIARVHVAGAVVRPGLYDVPAVARLGDAIERAGGPLATADLDRVNLAARVRDGQQIAVPERAAAAVGTSGGVPARVNLNRADARELDTLPGIGPVTAERILAHRERHGSFNDPRELRDAGLVNSATWARISDLVEAP